MDKSDFIHIADICGFEIRQHPISYTYRVFHAGFNGIYIDDFEKLGQAEEFCREEDVDYWARAIRDGGSTE